MEQVKREKDARSGRMRFASSLMSVAFCLAGCATPGPLFHLPMHEPGPEPCRVVAVWNPSVVFTPDPVHGGKENPGLAGRIYLFGPEISCPLLGNGGLAVQLFDDTKPCPEQDAKPLEEWCLDPATFKRLQRRDAIGWGYTVFLPWGTYKPEITHIHLKVCYQPPKGFPIYAVSSPITLTDPEQMKTLATGLAHVTPKSHPPVPVPSQGIATAAAQTPNR